MKQSARLWDESQGLFERCLGYPFVQGIANGTLEEERYREFIAQDAFFLEVFARGYAHCVATSPDRHGLYEFGALLNGTFDELRLHASASERLGLDLEATEPSTATLEYTDFLEEIVRSQASTGETLAAMTPCMRLYADIGRRLGEQGLPATPLYREWIETYAGEGFQDLATLVEQLLDRYGTNSEAERSNYLSAMQLELSFFDASWETDGVMPTGAKGSTT